MINNQRFMHGRRKIDKNEKGILLIFKHKSSF